MSTKQTQPIAVKQEHLSEAHDMWKSLPGWYITDQVLASAQEKFPSNTSDDCVLLKVVLLDGLYATNVRFHGLSTIVAHVVQVFKKKPALEGRQLVQELAGVQVKDKHVNLISFASKYVHFFRDNTVPIADWYAAFALTRHFGVAQARAQDWTREYGTYCQKIDELIRISLVSAQAREMDHYLWLAGNWITLQEHPDKDEINNELKTFFKRKDMTRRARDTFGELLK